MKLKKKRLRNYIRLNKAKKTWQLNTKHVSKLDPFVISGMTETLDKN